MAHILVTGGAGYIGSVCTHALIAAGHRVTIIDNLSKGRKDLIHNDARFYRLDLAKDDLAAAFKDEPIDAIIHFAAYKAVGESMSDAPKYSDNITGLINLLNAAHTHQVKRIVFSSSAAVYGEPQAALIDENHPTEPVSFYGFTKLDGERILDWYHRIHGIEYVALRYFNVVGDRLGYLDPAAQNVLPLMMEVAAGRREELLIYGDDYDTIDGTGVRDYIDVNDLVDAHIKALTLKSSAIINLGTAQGTSVKELIALVEEATGKTLNARLVPRRPGDPATVVASNERAKALLAWTPTVPLKESVAATWKAYLQEKRI